jgi:hypothetical protein
MILLIPVLTLFTGSMTMASSCAKMAAGAVCGEMGKAPVKSMLEAAHHGCPGQANGCGHKCNKGQTGKNEQKGKGNGGGCCVDCPLCCLVTLKSFFRWEVTQQITVIDYTVMPDYSLSDYFQQHWKPPGGAFLS